MLKTGLIGKKLGHSLSPQIHQRFYDITNSKGCYSLLETPADNLGTLLVSLETEGYTGVNVTIPYKTEVMQYLHEISDKAAAIGAVNTVLFKNGKRLGYNTDYYGLKALLDFNGIRIKNKRVVILGTGGAAKCAFRLVLDNGASETIVASRNPNATDNALRATGYDTLDSLKNIDVLINTTPVGMYPNTNACPIPDSIIQKCDNVVDMIYNPKKTVLLQKAQACGKTAVNGLLMLTAQAVKAQEIWNHQTYNEQTYQDVFSFINSLKNKKTNLVLIGMPGSGKTSIGKQLAQRLGMDFVDTDSKIEEKHGNIPGIFKGKGESVFREYEHQAAVDASQQTNTVISTGGGIILNKNNVTALKDTGVVFFLNRPLEKLLNDIDTSGRPLLADGKHRLKSLYDVRYPLYQEYADYDINNDEEVEACVNTIISKWKEM